MQRCFLDVDGVLCDFMDGIHQALGIDYDPSHWPYKHGPDGWHFHDELGLTFEQLSAHCDFTFWQNLRWTHFGRDILRVLLQHFGKEQITLLTSLMPHIESASGKMAWIKKHLPEYERQTIICSSPKEILAGVPDSFLIDDCQKNVDRWQDAGGTAILIPQPWNSLFDVLTWPAFNLSSVLELILSEIVLSGKNTCNT